MTQSAVAAPPDLARLAAGHRMEVPLLVTEVDRRDSARGGFTILTLGNRHGRLPTAPFWPEDQPRIAGIERGAVAQVVGEIGLYNGKRQLKVSSIRLLPRGAVDWRWLLPSVADVTPYWDRLDRWRSAVRGSRLRGTLELCYADPDFRRRFEQCPASTSGHHAELGGLLRHTCEVATIGRAIARACHADPQLVLAGALLHESESSRPTAGTEYSRPPKPAPCSATSRSACSCSIAAWRRPARRPAPARSSRCCTTSSRPTTESRSSVRRSRP